MADPIPSEKEFVDGIEHRNNEPSNQEKLYHPIRAIGTGRPHFFARIKEAQEKFHQEAGNIELREGSFYHRLYEHLPDPRTGGPLEPDEWQKLVTDGLVKNPTDYIKTVLNAHDGEANVLRGDWREFETPTYAASGAPVSFKAGYFWQAQTCRKYEARKFLNDYWQQNQMHTLLSDEDINWVMSIENNFTSLLSWQGDADDRPASGGQWFWRVGNFVTLPELFYYLGDEFHATELYHFYFSLFPFFTRRFKQTSHTAQGTKRVNSRLLFYLEEGKGKKGQGKGAKGKEVKGKGKEFKGANKKGKDKGKKGSKGKGKGK